MEFYTCDVFTEQRFGGNPLAVIPDARGLDAAQMQQIALEFNYSESTFVFPPEQNQTRRVRIFTPTVELPFAGHPNIGTAFVLASIGALGASPSRVVFEEGAGLVPVEIAWSGGRPTWCELQAPAALSVERTASPEQAAAALSIEPDEVSSVVHPPQVASVGLEFLFVELVNRSALERLRVDVAGFEALVAAGLPDGVYAYVRGAEATGLTVAAGDFDIHSRMFVPLDGVQEDPATGSAGCALVALLAHLDGGASEEFRLRIAQGVEMGRPSMLDARAIRRGGEVVSAHIGGSCVMVARGELQLD